MEAEVVLSFVYGAFLLSLAHWLVTYGRKHYGPANPANHSALGGPDADPQRYHEWNVPHSDAIRFTLGLAIVVTTVVMFMTVVMIVRHPDVFAAVLLLPLAGAGVATSGRLLNQFRLGAD